MDEREIERVYKAVANRKRVLIVRYLQAVRTATVGDIAKAIRLSFKATSRHLQLLSGTGYVTSEQHGLYVYYSLSPKSDFINRVLRTVNL